MTTDLHPAKSDVLRGLLRAITLLLPIKLHVWERYKWFRGIFGGAVFVSSLFAVAKWWLWWTQDANLYVPIVWTVVTVLLIAIGPQGRRRLLIGGVLAVYMLYGVKGLLLDHLPQAVILLIIPGALSLLLVATAPQGYFD